MASSLSYKLSILGRKRSDVEFPTTVQRLPMINLIYRTGRHIEPVILYWILMYCLGPEGTETPRVVLPLGVLTRLRYLLLLATLSSLVLGRC